jgi:hypothetical protein
VKIDNSIPAFPLSRENEGWHQPGMSLRDWFAGMTLAGAPNRPGNPKEIAEFAYRCADAMLTERDTLSSHVRAEK